jgi:predicted acetyltransferase
MHAFPGGRTLIQRMQDLEQGGAYGGVDATFVAHVGAELVGAIKMYRMSQYLGGSALPMMGLAAVAVAPSARRRGYGRAMCRQGLAIARDRGDVASALYPFRPDFYRSLGWGTVGELHSYIFPPEALTCAEVLPVRLAGGEDERSVRACYDRVARRSNGLLQRSERAWRQHLDAPATHVYLCARSEVAGFVRVRYGESPAAAFLPLTVLELVAEDEEAYTSLLAWLSRQRELWRRIRYDALPEEQFAHRLTDPRVPGYRPARRLWAPVAHVIRGPMLRLLDVRRALTERRTWGAAPAFTMGLRVRDPELPANEQPLTLAWDGSGVRVHADSLTADVSVHTDAATFAQIYVGELSVSDAGRLGLAEVLGDTAGADALFAAETFRLLDEF